MVRGGLCHNGHPRLISTRNQLSFAESRGLHLERAELLAMVHRDVQAPMLAYIDQTRPRLHERPAYDQAVEKGRFGRQ